MHLRRHSKSIQGQDETGIMARKRKHSKLWDYFEELKPSLVKCTKCKKEIHIRNPTSVCGILRKHLNTHGIFLDNDTHKLPDDLRQYYSELPGYEAKCNDCGKAISFISNIANLRQHLRIRHSKSIQGQDETVIMARKRKRSKLWDYFEELKPSLVKCTKCKKKIHIPNPTSVYGIFRRHLNGHGIFPDNDTHKLPDDLRQYYSELPGYKAKCNDCGKAISLASNIASLRLHLKRHSKRIQSGDGTVIMVRSKVWDYFDQLEPLLVKCRKCKKEIRMPNSKVTTPKIRVLMAHLKEDGIYFKKHTIPSNLRQYYSKLPGYKAKCNDCGKVLSFSTNCVPLRKHLRRHSIIIQCRDKKHLSGHGILPDNGTHTLPDDLRQYYSELPGYKDKAYCNDCGEIISFLHNNIELRQHLNRHLKRIQSGDEQHLSGDGILPDNDTHTLPDDLRQYYSELPGYKAKCNDCGKAISFASNITYVRMHLRRHSKSIQEQDETFKMARRKRRNKLWDYFEELKPSLVKCTKCKKEIRIRSKNVTRKFRTHLSKHGIFLANDIHTLPYDLRQYYSELPGYKAKCNDCGKAISLASNIASLRLHLKRHSKRIQSGDGTVIMARKRKRSKLWDYFEELKPSLVKCTKCEKEIHIRNRTSVYGIFRGHLSEHGIFPDNDTHTLPDDYRQYYSELPGYKAKCNDCGRTVSFLSHREKLRMHLRRHSKSIQGQDETVIMARKRRRSKLWDYFEELKPSLVKCTKCKKEIHIRHRTSACGIFRGHLSEHGIFLDNDTHTLPDDCRQYYSELPKFKAKCNYCGQVLSFLTNYELLRIHLRRHSIIMQRRDK